MYDFLENITIIGTGRLGSAVSTILQQNSIPHTILGRANTYSLTGIVYICVPENAIATVANSIVPHPNVLVLHSSGSLGLETLHEHEHIGCLHPIQSFTLPFQEIPKIIPATFQGDDQYLPLVEKFAAMCNFQLYKFTGDRLAYHTAAVVAGNFATILFHASVELLKKQGFSFADASALLHPLAEQSIANASNGSLQQVLTGPISRNQTELLEKQLQHLHTTYPELATVYGSCVQLATQLLQHPPA
jgi:predicted short-subunit dehydrogenase-like oxidoreductase (DUF2520 family)